MTDRIDTLMHPRPLSRGSKLVAAMILILLAATFSSATEPLRVGTRHVPPFAIQSDDGHWSGIAIELWQRIAEDLEITFVLEDHPVAELLDELENGQLDVAVAALTITTSREEKVDFTHPFYHSGLGIAVAPTPLGWLRQLAEIVLSVELLKAIAALLAVLFLAGTAVWWFERRDNAEQFGGGLAGLGAAFWWSAVTMTTVGYGDKAPRTVGGRLLAVVWMFTSVIIISGFTAAIASSFTVARLRTGITGPDDLGRARVATVRDSTAAAYLDARGTVHRDFDLAHDALAALSSGEVDAVVYDAPVLHYLASQNADRSFRTLDVTFAPQDYGFGLPASSPRREAINRRLLARTAEPEWAETLRRYLGQ